MKNRKPAYAVVRVDLESLKGAETDWPLTITVKEVVGESEEADSEVARLNALNGEKGVVYFTSYTRLAPSVGRND